LICFGSKVPLGEHNFRQIITGHFSFIDKSHLISGFIQDAAKVALVIRPQRFGKTTSLNMLYSYFVMGTSESELKGRWDLYSDLKIGCETSDFHNEHFARYPVIYFSLKVRAWHVLTLRLLFVDLLT